MPVGGFALVTLRVTKAINISSNPRIFYVHIYKLIVQRYFIKFKLNDIKLSLNNLLK